MEKLEEIKAIMEVDRRRTRARLDEVESEIQGLRQEIVELRNASLVFRKELEESRGKG